MRGSTVFGALGGKATATRLSANPEREGLAARIPTPCNVEVQNHSQTTQFSVGVSYLVEQPPHCDLLRLSLFDWPICPLQTDTSADKCRKEPGLQTRNGHPFRGWPFFFFEIFFQSFGALIPQPIYQNFSKSKRGRQEEEKKILKVIEYFMFCSDPIQNGHSLVGMAVYFLWTIKRLKGHFQQKITGIQDVPRSKRARGVYTRFNSRFQNFFQNRNMLNTDGITALFSKLCFCSVGASRNPQREEKIREKSALFSSKMKIFPF